MSDKVLHVKHEEVFYAGYTQHFPYVGEDAIYVPCVPVSENVLLSNYKPLITKDLFVEAYNKWIKGENNE